jgi:hypothetical protein
MELKDLNDEELLTLYKELNGFVNDLNTIKEKVGKENG